jgi:hypothetical protein
VRSVVGLLIVETGEELRDKRVPVFLQKIPVDVAE